MCKTLETQEQAVDRKEYKPPRQTVTIFDWDDTILCTTYLEHRKDANPDLIDAIKEKLQHIEAPAISLFEQAKTLSSAVYIVTNASPGWVENSCRQYFPKLVEILKGIQIVSARDEYERQYPGDAVAWKTQAFLDIRTQLCFDLNGALNIIVLGDSHAEMMAAEAMGRDLDETFLKTVKFVETPSLAELQKQVELVEQKFDKIVAAPRRTMKIDLRRVSGDSDKKTQGPKSRAGHLSRARA